MKEDNSDSEVTAVLSILKESHAYDRLGNVRSSPGSVPNLPYYYTILLWFIGQKVLLPPYLPRISARVEASRRDDILNSLRELSNQYLKNYGDHKLTVKESAEVLECVQRVGGKIASYPHPLYDCLKFLWESETSIKNLVIHTDEHSIPWHLAYSEYRPDFEHLCDRYPCGTILVEDCDNEAFKRFINYNKRHRHQDSLQKAKGQICLVAGELGESAKGGKDCGVAYVERLKAFLERFEHLHGMKVRCIYPEEWKQYEGNRKRAVHRLDDLFDQAQIVHFTCHVVEEKDARTGEPVGMLKLGRDLMIGPDDLKNLSELGSRPLVVLHGCSSAGPVAPGSDGAQLCKAFLYRRAGGCLATVFPVNIPTDPTGGAEDLLEYFYHNVFLQDSYGVALYKARQSMREHSEKLGVEKDPQALFYQLYGDPRETLISTRKETIADKIALIQKMEMPDTPEIQTCIVRVSGENIDGQDVLQVLRMLDGVENADLQPRAALMGPEIISELMDLNLVFVVTGSWVAYELGRVLRNRFKHAKVEVDVARGSSRHAGTV